MSLLLLFGLEALLNWFDPWGAVRYFKAGGPTTDLYIPHESRYVLPAGDYDFGNWAAQIAADFTRNVPDNGVGACRIIFLGDSVTFGLGVDDDETWANQLAARHPAWDVVNAAVPGYNSSAVRDTLRNFDADAYAYLIIANDAGPLAFYPDIQQHNDALSAIAIYWQTWRIQQRGFEHPPQMIEQNGQLLRRFDADIAALAALPRLLMAGFEGDGLAESARVQYESLVLIPPYHSQISFADPHPDAEGHLQIADAIEPHVVAHVHSHCGLES